MGDRISSGTQPPESPIQKPLSVKERIKAYENLVQESTPPPKVQVLDQETSSLKTGDTSLVQEQSGIDEQHLEDLESKTKLGVPSGKEISDLEDMSKMLDKFEQVKPQPPQFTAEELSQVSLKLGNKMQFGLHKGAFDLGDRLRQENQQKLAQMLSDGFSRRVEKLDGTLLKDKIYTKATTEAREWTQQCFQTFHKNSEFIQGLQAMSPRDLQDAIVESMGLIKDKHEGKGYKDLPKEKQKLVEAMREGIQEVLQEPPSRRERTGKAPDPEDSPEFTEGVQQLLDGARETGQSIITDMLKQSELMPRERDPALIAKLSLVSENELRDKLTSSLDQSELSPSLREQFVEHALAGMKSKITESQLAPLTNRVSRQIGQWEKQDYDALARGTNTGGKLDNKIVQTEKSLRQDILDLDQVKINHGEDSPKVKEWQDRIQEKQATIVRLKEQTREIYEAMHPDPEERMKALHDLARTMIVDAQPPSSLTFGLEGKSDDELKQGLQLALGKDLRKITRTKQDRQQLLDAIVEGIRSGFSARA